MRPNHFPNERNKNKFHRFLDKSNHLCDSTTPRLSVFFYIQLKKKNFVLFSLTNSFKLFYSSFFFIFFIPFVFFHFIQFYFLSCLTFVLSIFLFNIFKSNLLSLKLHFSFEIVCKNVFWWFFFHMDTFSFNWSVFSSPFLLLLLTCFLFFPFGMCFFLLFPACVFHKLRVFEWRLNILLRWKRTIGDFFFDFTLTLHSFFFFEFSDRYRGFASSFSLFIYFCIRLTCKQWQLFCHCPIPIIRKSTKLAVHCVRTIFIHFFFSNIHNHNQFLNCSACWKSMEKLLSSWHTSHFEHIQNTPFFSALHLESELPWVRQRTKFKINVVF